MIEAVFFGQNNVGIAVYGNKLVVAVDKVGPKQGQRPNPICLLVEGGQEDVRNWAEKIDQVVGERKTLQEVGEFFKDVTRGICVNSVASGAVVVSERMFEIDQLVLDYYLQSQTPERFSEPIRLQRYGYQKKDAQNKEVKNSSELGNEAATIILNHARRVRVYQFQGMGFSCEINDSSWRLDHLYGVDLKEHDIFKEMNVIWDGGDYYNQPFLEDVDVRLIKTHSGILIGLGQALADHEMRNSNVYIGIDLDNPNESSVIFSRLSGVLSELRKVAENRMDICSFDRSLIRSIVDGVGSSLEDIIKRSVGFPRGKASAEYLLGNVQTWVDSSRPIRIEIDPKNVW